MTALNRPIFYVHPLLIASSPPGCKMFIRWQLKVRNPKQDLPLECLEHFVRSRLRRLPVIQGHWFGPVDHLLNQPTLDGRRKRVLDVGTGTGAWVREMAGLFPAVDFEGLDVVPVPPPPRHEAGPVISSAPPSFLIDDDSSTSSNSESDSTLR